MISGNMTFNCISRVAEEAEQIAWLVSRHFWILRRILQKCGFHDIGQRTSIGSVSPPGALIAGDPGEIRNVPTTVPFHFQWTESVTPTNLILLEQISTTVEVLSPRINGAPASSRTLPAGVAPNRRIEEPEPEAPRPGGTVSDPPITFTVET
jgi:hypothetical protein